MKNLGRVIVAPVALTGDARPAAVAAAVVGAELRAAAGDPAQVELLVGVLEGDLASQHAVERELFREALDRSVMDRDAFVARVRDAEAIERDRLAGELVAAGVEVDLEAGRIGIDDAARAARTAFVRLFDEGLLERAERVVDVCPRCTTVVDPADSSVSDAEAELVSLGLSGDADADGDGDAVLVVDMVELELLLGVIAVGVPEGHPAVGSMVTIPLAGREVPVVVDDSHEAPWFVIPAHDEAALAVARRLGIVPVPVLDDDGIVAAEGPLLGQARYAARAAANDLLDAEGAVGARLAITVDLARCARCSTPLVPRLGSHWFLRTADLEIASADMVRNGDVVIDDPDARERFVGRAGAGGDWCLSHQVWAGQAVPAGRCLDCGQIAVAVEPQSSCGKCMGELVSTEDVLDARFVAAVWPLAVCGWPTDERLVVTEAPLTVAVAAADSVTGWALPAAALGLRLAGVVPFAELAAVPAPADAPGDSV